ncbi:MAG: PepSY-associated TM helix domain-containing protein [Nocardioides sp.]
MTDVYTPAPSAPSGKSAKPASESAKGWFRAAWRWHFYASFLVIPVLLLLAVTGLIYLLRFQLEPLLHADVLKVERVGERMQPYDQQQAAVREAYPEATIISMTEPLKADDATRFSIADPASGDAATDVYVDPFSGKILGSLNPDTTLSGYAVRLHGELMAGKPGDALIELGACWGIVMAITGYYMFFRGWRARKRRLASGAPGAKLRSRHAMAGAVTGAALLMLLVSGLPWTGFWGERVQTLATDRNSSLWSLDPGAESDSASTLDKSLPHSHAQEVPWGAGKSEVPQSEGVESAAGRKVANLDTAVLVAAREGLRHPMTVALPADDRGVFSVLGYAFNDPSREGTVHVDQYGGQVVASYGFEDYPVLAKVVSQGIGLHEGRSLGLVSFWAAILMCATVIFSCITGPMMWWRRRPKKGGSIGAPRGRMPIKSSPMLIVALVALGIFLPFFGLSLVALLLIDQLILRRIGRLAGWFDAA